MFWAEPFRYTKAALLEAFPGVSQTIRFQPGLLSSRATLWYMREVLSTGSRHKSLGRHISCLHFAYKRPQAMKAYQLVKIRLA